MSDTNAALTVDYVDPILGSDGDILLGSDGAELTYDAVLTVNKQPSINYIPEGLRGDTLFQTACELIDIARQFDPTTPIAILDPLIAQLGVVYANAEAVQAYHNMFIKPALGTPRVIEYVLAIMGEQAIAVEWFNSGQYLPEPLTPYHFMLVFTSEFDISTLPTLLYRINLVKNERSHLGKIIQPGILGRTFLLDSTTLESNAVLDGISGGIIDVNAPSV